MPEIDRAHMARDKQVRLTEGRRNQSVHGIDRAHVARPVDREITKFGLTEGRPKQLVLEIDRVHADIWLVWTLDDV